MTTRVIPGVLPQWLNPILEHVQISLVRQRVHWLCTELIPELLDVVKRELQLSKLSKHLNAAELADELNIRVTAHVGGPEGPNIFKINGRHCEIS